MRKLNSARCVNRRLSLAAMFLFFAAASPAFAQYTLNTLTSDVNEPVGPLVLSGNTLYGAEKNPDEWYSLPTTGGTPTELAPVGGGGGDDPSSGLLLSGNTLYGASLYSGVYSLPTSGGTPTNLGAVTNGYLQGGLLLDGATLYSATGYSDPGNGGVVSISTTGGGANLLTDFVGTTNGYMPLGGLVASTAGTSLYGTASQGGSSSDGTVFKVATSNGAITRLASFNGTDGENPSSTLVLSGNTLYGTTPNGGSGDGVVFSMPATGGTPTVLLSFSGANGADPLAGLLLSNNTLYGTTYGGGAYGDGEVFSLPTTGGTPTLLASFNGTDGWGPQAGLIMDSNGDLFGTTSLVGTVFELAVPEPTSLTLLGAAAGGLLLRRRTRRRAYFSVDTSQKGN